MKTRTKILSIICVVAILISSLAIFSVSAATYETPLEPNKWIDPNFETDVAYSFAFVGDTQYITCGDYYLGTKKLNQVYQYIADTADERKLEHVFVLGDMTDLGYKNDGNLASGYYTTPLTKEWEIVSEAISKLNGVVPYSIVRGNHDDYMMDDYFNVPAYKNQFNGCGGFYSDSNAKWTDISGVSKSREGDNSGAWVYWSAKTGRHTETVANSWKTVNVQGTDYLFITIDFNPTDNVLKWVDDTLKNFPDHKAIITTHSYLNGSGEVISSDSGSTMYLFGNPGTVLWDEVLSKHENVFMIVSGHTGGVAPTYSYNTGVHGNEVLQVLVDPQEYDAKEIDSNGKIEHGEQDTGLILYMNFSKDGKRINFDYYSTLLGKFLKGTNHTIYIEADEDARENKDTSLTNLGAKYGQVNTYLTKKTTVAPTLNGVIADNEYDFTRVTKADSKTNKFEGDLTEYFSYDDDFVYYAFTFKQTKAGQQNQINFKTNYDTINKSDVSPATHWPRQQILFTFSEEGNLTTHAPGRMLSNDWGDSGWNMSLFRWNKDVFISGSRNTTTKYNTVELKIRKAYLDENDPEKEIQSLAYVLYFNKNANGEAMWHQFNNTSASNAALGHDWWMYQYMIFADNPISTLSTASVRISSTNSGLRFKSEIDSGYLSKLKADNTSVEIGTLIAPTDTLNGKKLTHDIGKDGEAYVDVKATVNKPFEEKKNGTTIYAGSIVNISEKNLDRDFSAVGYIKVTDNGGKVTYYYSQTTTTRNVSDVAEDAYGDISKTKQTGYSNLVTVDDDIAKGFYSPYTKGQRKILKELIAYNSKKDPYFPDIF